MRTFAVSIVGWDEHQERSDRKNYIWFKFYSKTVDGHLWLHASHEEFRVWTYLMCVRSRLGGVTIYFSDDIIAAHCKVKASSVPKIVSRLIELGSLRDEAGTSAESAGQMLVLEENRIEENRGEPAAASPLTPTWLLERWNELSGTLRKAKALDSKRTKDAKARLQEHPNCDDWITAITQVAASTKCQGFENEPGKFQNWKADFDWLIKPGRLNQILEGKWDGRGVSGRSSGSAYATMMNAKKAVNS